MIGSRLLGGSCCKLACMLTTQWIEKSIVFTYLHTYRDRLLTYIYAANPVGIIMSSLDHMMWVGQGDLKLSHGCNMVVPTSIPETTLCFAHAAGAEGSNRYLWDFELLYIIISTGICFQNT